MQCLIGVLVINFTERFSVALECFQYFRIITQLNKEQRISILLVEQNAKLALNVAPHAYVMETGRIVMDDSSEKLAQNEDIKDFYLGLTDKGGRKSFRDVKHYKRRKRWLA